VLKWRSNGQTAYVNGENKGDLGNMGNFTVYVNPYLVLKSGGYTKHYYIEGQRIVSKLGGGIDNNGKGPLKAGEGKVDYNGKQQKIRDGIVKNLKFLGLDGSILTAGKSGKVPPGQLNTKTQGGGKTDTETFQYFFHPDHLGSTSYITDASGEVYQHLEYFAFGETFVEEHSNTDRTPYLYNGKELDEETGLYYYGARYYDARVSIWLAVDPKAEEFIGWSPYNYAMNSPIVYIDPDGRAAIKWPPGWWVEHGTRIVGGLKVIGGAAEMVAGGAAILTPEPTMVTKVVGAAAVVHGADNVSAGLTQMMTGQDQSTLTSQGMQAAGVSKETADLVDGGVTIALTGGAAALTKTAQLPSVATATANATKGGIKNIDDFLASASQNNGNGLTNAGRALQKHSGREGSVFQTVKFSHKTANEDAMKIVKNIMESGNQIIKQAKQGGYEIYDKTTGMGIGVSREGLFNGFRELID
jgi:RHS repeat-associated protein